MVVDASVVVKLLVQEPLSDRVDALFNLMAQDMKLSGQRVGEFNYGICKGGSRKLMQKQPYSELPDRGMKRQK